jgi:hypothetical protein
MAARFEQRPGTTNGSQTEMQLSLRMELIHRK